MTLHAQITAPNKGRRRTSLLGALTNPPYVAMLVCPSVCPKVVWEGSGGGAMGEGEEGTGRRVVALQN